MDVPATIACCDLEPMHSENISLSDCCHEAKTSIASIINFSDDKISTCTEEFPPLYR